MNKTLDTYKAEAIEYRMFFAKAHAYQTEWLKKYVAKNPPVLPDMLPDHDREADDMLREQLDTISAYEQWTERTIQGGKLPQTLKETILRVFSLE